MTDNEIIKALECCAQPDPICKECPCYDAYLKYPCTDQLKWAALNLIDRQKAKIERLRGLLRFEAEGANTLNDVIAEQQAEIKRLTTLAELGNIRANDYRAMRDKAKNARAEAIKEFAERLKEKAYPFPCAIGVEYAVTIRAINDLVKKMTEGEE